MNSSSSLEAVFVLEGLEGSMSGLTALLELISTNGVSHNPFVQSWRSSSQMQYGCKQIHSSVLSPDFFGIGHCVTAFLSERWSARELGILSLDNIPMFGSAFAESRTFPTVAPAWRQVSLHFRNSILSAQVNHSVRIINDPIVDSPSSSW